MIELSMATESSCLPLERLQEKMGGEIRHSLWNTPYLLMDDKGCSVTFHGRSRSYQIFRGIGPSQQRKLKSFTYAHEVVRFFNKKF